jgi:hypothetical protein
MAMQFPKAYLEASSTKSEAVAKKIGAAAATTQKKLTARIDMSAEVAGKGLCPECRQPMTASHANGIPVLVCEDHRIALPVADSE